MATQTVEFRSPPTQTITAKLFTIGSDTQVASVTATEATNRKGTYAAAFTDVAAGEYELISLVSTTPVARWFVTLTLTTATFQAYDKVSVAAGVTLDSASIMAIYNTMPDAGFTDGSFGDRWLISSGNQRTVQITGGNHIAADIHNLQSGVITASDFAADAITASALAADAVTEIQSGLATASALAAAKTILDKVDTGLVVDGAVYQFTSNMLELGPSGGGGSSVNVLPATGIVSDRSAGTTLLPVVGETISQSITVYQSDGTTAVNLSAKTLKVIFETMSGVDVAVVLAADITISGASSNVVTFAYPPAVTASERTLRFAIRDAAAPLTMYLQGVCSVVAAPKVDA